MTTKDYLISIALTPVVMIAVCYPVLCFMEYVARICVAN